MRIAATLFTLLLLAFSTLAGSGCKRPAAADMAALSAPPTAFTRMVHVAMAHPLASASLSRTAMPSQPTFVFCHPRADQLDDSALSAAAAQVAFDLQANNDDRTEMITPDLARDAMAPRPQVLVPALAHAHTAVWLRVLLRPPRPLQA